MLPCREAVFASDEDDLGAPFLKGNDLLFLASLAAPKFPLLRVRALLVRLGRSARAGMTAVVLLFSGALMMMLLMTAVSVSCVDVAMGTDRLSRPEVAVLVVVAVAVGGLWGSAGLAAGPKPGAPPPPRDEDRRPFIIPRIIWR